MILEIYQDESIFQLVCQVQKGDTKKIVTKLGSGYDAYYKQNTNKVADVDVAILQLKFKLLIATFEVKEESVLVSNKQIGQHIQYENIKECQLNNKNIKVNKDVLGDKKIMNTNCCFQANNEVIFCVNEDHCLGKSKVIQKFIKQKCLVTQLNSKKISEK